MSTATRTETLPGIPTVAEFVPGFEASTWFGIGAPKSTPVEIVGRLTSEAQGKVLAAVNARVPTVTPEEQRALQLECQGYRRWPRSTDASLPDEGTTDGLPPR